MGRKSREKREQRERRAAQAAAASEKLLGLTSKSVVALLDAASVSPTAAHRGMTISLLVQALGERTDDGRIQARADQLGPLLAAAGDKHASLLQMEDFQPYDSRLGVLVRWGPELRRMLPGSQERPTALIDQHMLLGSAIDSVVEPVLGYGLIDVGSLILNRLDDVYWALHEAWPIGDQADVGEGAVVSPAEFAAACTLPTPEQTADRCVRPTQARAALAELIVPWRDINFQLTDPVAPFGPALGTYVAGTPTFFPAGLLIDALPAVGARLAAAAVGINSAVEERYAQLVALWVARLLRGAGYALAGPVRCGSSGEIHSVVRFSDTQYLALDVVAGLTPRSIQDKIESGSRALARVGSGATLRTQSGPMSIRSDASILTLQVVASPMHGRFIGADGPVMTLEDLQWIVRAEKISTNDLWFFIRDLSESVGIGSMFAWDLIDQWEVWYQQKSFYRGGDPLSAMIFAPHSAIAEWRKAAERSPIEEALHRLKLPPLRAWPILDVDEHGVAHLGDLATQKSISVMAGGLAVSVSRVDAQGPEDHFESLWRLSEAILWHFWHMRETLLRLGGEAEFDAMRIGWTFDDGEITTIESPIEVEWCVENELKLLWGPDLGASLARDSLLVEDRLGEKLSVLFLEHQRPEFIAAWRAVPPGIRVDGFYVNQVQKDLPEPLEPHLAERASVLRDLGSYLRYSGVSPGIYEGLTGTRLESATIFPWLIGQLHAAADNLDADELLRFGLDQLECVSFHRFMSGKRLAWQAGFPLADTSALEARRRRLSELSIHILLVVEEILARPPTGKARIDSGAWIKLLSLAEFCSESCHRSDALYHRLSGAAVEITDNYEVRTTESKSEADIDFDSYTRARSSAMLPQPEPMSDPDESTSDIDADGPTLVEAFPELTPLSDALLGELGFSLQAIIETLGTATAWPVQDRSSISLEDPSAIVRRAVDRGIRCEESEIVAALDWLTIRASDLNVGTIPHWETERRLKRLRTSPFVAWGLGVFVLPWAAGETFTIFSNYLKDGRLPWPGNDLPKRVQAALNEYRQRQNRQLEKDCVDALKDAGFTVVPSLLPRKAAQIGIVGLSGEIDCLCCDIERSRLWVIEVKDPFTPYSTRQVRRLVDDFLENGKYIDKLLHKVADVARCKTSFAAAINLPESDRDWDVVGLVLTRHVEPAAFARTARVQFSVLEDLVPTLTAG